MTVSEKTYNDYIEEMLLAIQANIQYLKKHGSSQIKVKNGILINIAGETSIYQFEFDILQEVDPGTEVEVRMKGQTVGGKIVAIAENTLDLQVEGNLGEKISEATLLISNYYLLEKLTERLEKIKDGGVTSAKIAEKLLGILSHLSGKDDAYIIPSKEYPLTGSQEDALRSSLASDVSFIWGPPGTGKSETIGSIVEGLLKKNLSVLLIAHTNKATDGAMKKVVKLLKNTPDYRDGKFIREGHLKSIDPELLLENVIPEKIIENKSAPIRSEINSIQSKINESLESIEKYEEYTTKKEELNNLEKEAAHLNRLFESKKEEKILAESKKRKNDNLLRDIDIKISNFQDKGFVGRMFSGESLEGLTKKKIDTLRTIDEKNQSIELLNKDIWSLKAHLRTTDTRVSISKENLSAFKVEDFSESFIKSVKKDIKNFKAQLKVLNEQLIGLSDDLIKGAKVIATTLTRSYMSKNILDREYDCIILDEASMAPLPAVICAASLAKEKVILVGDFYQLPPIAKHDVDPEDKTPEEVEKEKELVARWLKRDIFEFVGITEDVKQGRTPDWLVQLKEQFRMHPDISALVNKLVYQYYNDKFKLENGANTSSYGEEKLNLSPLCGAHLGIYDTSQLGSVASKAESGSIYNITHALLAIVLAKQALDSGYKKIGIISAYRAQVNLINKMLRDEMPEIEDEIIADTVHRFQGDEREVIIFDVTVAKRRSMYDDGGDGGDDMKLLNVAFSRAQEKCIILADIKEITKNHSESSLVKRAIEHCLEKKHPTEDCNNLLNQYSADDKTEEWLEKMSGVEELIKDIENGELFSETDFYPNFIRDIFRAEQEIIINSPFITSYRSEKLKPIFSHLLKKGIKMFIITRSPEEHKDAMKDQSLKELKEYEKMGIIVLPFIGNIHQKFAILDREILWDGSLNILSQRDSVEIMRRYAGISAVEQIMSFLKLDKNIGEIGKNNLKRCETCKAPGSWYWQKKMRFGKIWKFCLTGVHGVGKLPKTKAEKEKKKKTRTKVRSVIILDSTGIPQCPQHKIPTVQKDGYWGPYWSCLKVKECDYQVSDTKVQKANKQPGLL